MEMKKVDTKRKQTAKMRMMCGKTLRDLEFRMAWSRDRIGVKGVKDIQNYLGETRLRSSASAEKFPGGATQKKHQKIAKKAKK